MTLHLGAGADLADDLVTKSVGILAQRRKGKTYTASVMAEEMVANGIPWVAIDPTGAWWGLRASADGQNAGLPVVILGGQHGDVPLERSSGKLVAELVVDHPGWYILDLSLLESREADREFATAFATRLYRRKGQPNSDFALHLFVDEADLFVPQRVPSGDTTMVGAFEAIVRRGGLRGLGSTLISQRSAVVNKNVLEQLDLLIALRTVGPNDRKRIEEYVEAAGSPDQVKTLMGSLASLGLGEAWLWEPGGDPPLFDRVQIRERTTFNSSATPRSGETRIEPARLADVDLDAVKDQMAEVVRRAERDDPKPLRARIADLERELRARPAASVETVTETIEVPTPFVPASVRSLLTTIEELAIQARADIADLPDAVPTPRTTRKSGPTSHSTGPTSPSNPPRAPRAPTADGPTPDVHLGKGERTVLAVLAQYPDGRTYNEVAFLAGYSAKASTLGVILSSLRKANLVEPGNQPVRATAAGIDAAGGIQPLPSGPELLEHWLRHPRMGAGERNVLQALVDAYPQTLSHAELCERTGYSPDASTIGVILSKLRKLGLVEKNARRAASEFMDSIA